MTINFSFFQINVTSGLSPILIDCESATAFDCRIGISVSVKGGLLRLRNKRGIMVQTIRRPEEILAYRSLPQILVPKAKELWTAGPGDSSLTALKTMADENVALIVVLDQGRLVGVVSRGGHLDMTALGGLQVDGQGHLANWMIPGKMVAGMGGAMDLVTGAKRVIIAMQHAAKGKSKIVKKCNLPLTSVRAVDLVVTDMAVIGFPEGRATLMETAPGVSVAEVMAVTEAELSIPDHVPQMKI
jgi:acyl CoA:acetate/3-ketoacid CoA transferase beta subunit